MRDWGEEGSRDRYGTSTERAVAPAHARGRPGVRGGEQGQQRAGGYGTPGPCAPGDGAGAHVRPRRAGGGFRECDDGSEPGRPLQPAGAGGAADCGGARAARDLWRRRAGTDRGRGAAGAAAARGSDGDVVAHDTATAVAAGRVATGRGDDDPPGAPRRGQFVPAHADVVPDGYGAAQAQGRPRPGHRPPDGGKKA